MALYRVQVTVELKNDLCITGKLHSVDQYLNVKLENIKLVNEAKYPHMVSLGCFCCSATVAAATYRHNVSKDHAAALRLISVRCARCL